MAAVPPSLRPLKPSLQRPCLSSRLRPTRRVCLSPELVSPLQHPILLSLGDKSAGSRCSEPRLRAASTAPSARPVLTPPEPRFLPQTAQARPPMGGRVSSPGSFRGLPCASKANADWMSALSSRLWDVPLHQLSIPGEAPRARLGGQAAARWSRVCEASVLNMPHAGTHTCTLHTKHARIRTHTREHTRTYRCVYTHIHTPAPSLLRPLHPHSTRKEREAPRACLRDTCQPWWGRGGCRAFSATVLVPGTPGNFAPTFSIRGPAASTFCT